MQHQSSEHDEPTLESAAVDTPLLAPTEPSGSARPSRRQVIAGAGAGLGLAATGALAGVAGSAVLAAGSAGGAAHSGAGGSDVVVAHVVDAGTGDIDVYVGESQVRIRDRAVAARLGSAR
jgi:hypothetical protein